MEKYEITYNPSTYSDIILANICVYKLLPLCNHPNIYYYRNEFNCRYNVEPQVSHLQYFIDKMPLNIYYVLS